jgi:hypothetical protein
VVPVISVSTFADQRALLVHSASQWHYQTMLTMTRLAQALQARLAQLNAHATQLQSERRAEGQRLAAELRVQAAAAEAGKRAARAAALRPDDFSRAMPWREDDGLAAMRAKAVDQREDLDVQIARKQARMHTSMLILALVLDIRMCVCLTPACFLFSACPGQSLVLAARTRSAGMCSS